MRVIVVGASGTIGSAVAETLKGTHEVLKVGRTSGDVHADLTSTDSLRKLFEQTGEVDAVISCAGSGSWKPLAELTDEDFAFALTNKLMGQVNLVRIGLEYVRDGGSITLTSGVLSQDPEPGSAAVSMINAGLEGFVRAAALEAPRGIRVNVVSPPWVVETLKQMGRDTSAGLPAAVVAKAYRHSLEGHASGAVIDARAFD